LAENNNIFSADNLSVRRGNRLVFEALSFKICAGQLLKLVGPNGSGKTTLLKTVSGLIKQTSGQIMMGEDIITQDTQWISRNISYLGHKNALKSELTVENNILFWASLFDNQHNMENALKSMAIEYLSDTPVKYLSSGQSRRAALARACCSGANIWLFDEPTVGLDEQGVSLLAGLMTKHLNEEGIIICATHVDLNLENKYVTTLDLSDFAPISKFEETELW
jgi:heme exporter protein A